MTTDAPEPEANFPDVAIGPKRALVGLIALAVLYAVIFVWLGAATHLGTWPRLASLYLATSFLVSSYIDMRTGLLPDLLTFPLIATGLVYAVWFTGQWELALAGAFVGYGLIAGLSLVWRNLRGQDGIGLGDAKLLSGIGAWLGLAGLPFVVLLASGIGLIIALIASQKSQDERHMTAIAFGPFLALAGWVFWCTGQVAFL